MLEDVRREITKRQSVRADVWDACGGVCHYCGAALHPFRNFEIDHVVSLKAGGEDTLANLVGACTTCNRAKNTKADRQGRREYRARELPICPDRIRERMQALDMSVYDVARVGGLTALTVNRVLRGQVEMPQPRTIRRLAQALGVEPRALLKGGR